MNRKPYADTLPTTLYTLHPPPCTLHPAPCIQHPSPVTPHPTPGPQNPVVGATAPGFTLPSTGGGSVTLSEVVASNKFTVLYFYNQDFSQAGSTAAPPPSSPAFPRPPPPSPAIGAPTREERRCVDGPAENSTSTLWRTHALFFTHHLPSQTEFKTLTKTVSISLHTPLHARDSSVCQTRTRCVGSEARAARVDEVTLELSLTTGGCVRVNV